MQIWKAMGYLEHVSQQFGKSLLEAGMLEGNIRSSISSVAYCKTENSKSLKINLAFMFALERLSYCIRTSLLDFS